MTLSDIAASVTGAGLMGKNTGGHVRPSPGEIARLAYSHFERRGRRDGHDLEDWLSAEQELTRHYREATNGKGHRV